MVADIKEVVAELKSLRLPLPRTQVLPDDALIGAYELELGVSFSEEYKFFAKEAMDSIVNGKDALQMTLGRNSPENFSTLCRKPGS